MMMKMKMYFSKGFNRIRIRSRNISEHDCYNNAKVVMGVIWTRTKTKSRTVPSTRLGTGTMRATNKPNGRLAGPSIHPSSRWYLSAYNRAKPIRPQASSDFSCVRVRLVDASNHHVHPIDGSIVESTVP